MLKSFSVAVIDRASPVDDPAAAWVVPVVPEDVPVAPAVESFPHAVSTATVTASAAAALARRRGAGSVEAVRCDTGPPRGPRNAREPVPGSDQVEAAAAPATSLSGSRPRAPRG